MRNAVLSAVVVSVLLSGCGRSVPAGYFPASLTEIDSLIEAQQWRDVAVSVLRAVRLAGSRREWLSLLKRAHVLATESGDYEAMERVAAKAHREMPGAEDVAGLYTYAALRMGDYDRALRLAREYLRSDSWSVVAREARLAVGAARGGWDEPGLILAGSAAELDPELFHELAQALADPRLYLNAALLYMRDGDSQRAAALVSQFSMAYPSAAAYISYDAGRAGDAAAHMETSVATTDDPRSLVIYADMLSDSGRMGDAEAACRRLIQEKPDFHWIPYLNVAYAAWVDGQEHEALSALERAMETYPSSLDVGLVWATIQMQVGSGSQSVVVLERLREEHPDSAGVAYALSLASVSQTTARRSESVLWTSFLQRPSCRDTAQYLLHTLYRARNSQGLIRVADLYASAVHETAWTHLYRGIGLAARGEIEAATEELRSSARISAQWQTFYNLATVAVYAGDYQAALEHLLQAQAVARGLPSAGGLLWVALAEAHRLSGNQSAALRAVRYALDLDPSLQKAALLLRMLEGSRD